MILSVFRAAARQQPGMRNGSARAMYGCDVMVTAALEPRLLEVTFSPGNLAASPAWTVSGCGGGGVDCTLPWATAAYPNIIFVFLEGR